MGLCVCVWCGGAVLIVDVWLYVWVHGCMDVWVYGCGCVPQYNGCPAVPTDMTKLATKRVRRTRYGCMGAWMYGCVDVWMYGCMDVCVPLCNGCPAPNRHDKAHH